MSDDTLDRLTAEIATSLATITRMLSEALRDEGRRLPEPLTAPQLLALEILVEQAQTAGTGLSLKDLSSRMGLAHSTVSGIVTRLEKRNLVTRSPQKEDRRYVVVELADPVKSWVEESLPAARRRPLREALAKASAADRAEIARPVNALAALLSDRQP